MKFLCLHGTGSNNQIFELQTSTIRSELGDDYDFDFVEGTIECSAGPGMEKLGAVSEDGYFAYFDESNAATMDAAIDQLDRYIKSEGPFDGIMGFSQGAGLAAMLILRMAGANYPQGIRSSRQPFKCAIFLSGEPPANPEALKQELVEWVDPNSSPLCGAISIPTAHIWGCNDSIYPDFGPVLYELCDDRQKVRYIHTGDHEIPGLKARNEAVKAVQTIRKVLDMVE